MLKSPFFEGSAEKRESKESEAIFLSQSLSKLVDIELSLEIVLTNLQENERNVVAIDTGVDVRACVTAVENFKLAFTCLDDMKAIIEKLGDKSKVTPFTSFTEKLAEQEQGLDASFEGLLRVVAYDQDAFESFEDSLSKNKEVFHWYRNKKQATQKPVLEAKADTDEHEDASSSSPGTPIKSLKL